MAITRWLNRNTSENAQELIRAINDPDTERVILFATLSKPDPTFTRADGPETNLPLLAALVLLNNGDKTVYDGLFLTAARQPRYTEVRAVLDAAVNTANVFFSETRARFTSALSEQDAVAKLKQLNLLKPLTPATRAGFFQLLSGLTEPEFEY